jgi:hypothetical protein
MTVPHVSFLNPFVAVLRFIPGTMAFLIVCEFVALRQYGAKVAGHKKIALYSLGMSLMCAVFLFLLFLKIMAMDLKYTETLDAIDALEVKMQHHWHRYSDGKAVW